MSYRSAMLAILNRLESAAQNSGAGLYASIRGAGFATPCFIWDASMQRVPIMPNGVWEWSTKASPYWQVDLTVTIVADQVNACFDLLDSLADSFDAGPYTVTFAAASYRLAVESFGPFSTDAASPDDGQQDAERTITGTISIHITEV